MTEEVLAIFPAFEIWGINRKTPCSIVLSDERIVVMKGKSGRRSLPRVRKDELKSSGIDLVLQGNYYSIPHKNIRWVKIRRFLTGTLLKIGTAGGGYRFKLRKGPSEKLKRRLEELAGSLVRLVE